MTLQKALEIIRNELPGCGDKIQYSEGEICEAFDTVKDSISRMQKYLRSAVDDWEYDCQYGNCDPCPYYNNDKCDKDWKYKDDVLKLLEEE